MGSRLSDEIYSPPVAGTAGPGRSTIYERIDQSQIVRLKHRSQHHAVERFN